MNSLRVMNINGTKAPRLGLLFYPHVVSWNMSEPPSSYILWPQSALINPPDMQEDPRMYGSYNMADMKYRSINSASRERVQG